MENKYQNRVKVKGAMFPNTYKTEGSQQPDMKGTLTISSAIFTLIYNQVKEIQAIADSGVRKNGTHEIKLELAGWNREAKGTGLKYLYVNAELLPLKKDEDEDETVSSRPYVTGTDEDYSNVETTPENDDEKIPF